ASMLPMDFIRCVSIDEARARLSTGRSWSAMIVGGDVIGVDRDLFAAAGRAGAPVIVVTTTDAQRWRDLGAAAVLDPAAEPDDVLDALRAHAEPLGGSRQAPEDAEVDRAALPPVGHLVAVTSSGGTGASVCAMALAQGWAQRTSGGDGDVVLVDLCRNADLAMYHDTRSLVPGIQELVEAHRHATPTPATVFDQSFAVTDRTYRLILGLRRARHWVGIRPATFAATLESIRRCWDMTVADTDPEVEGLDETGLEEIEERHIMSRVAFQLAAVVLVVLEPSLKGVHAGVRLIDDLVGCGVEPRRVLPVVNATALSVRQRHAVTAAVSALTDHAAPTTRPGVRRPVTLPRRDVDAAARDGRGMPPPLPRILATAVADALEAVGEQRSWRSASPQRVIPGSLRMFDNSRMVEH
ncbi:MAG: hypothetical protein WD152_02465, partial [Nitriliruptoraceae bacterium]